MEIGLNLEQPAFVALNAALYKDGEWFTQDTMFLLHTIRSLAAMDHLSHATGKDIASECDLCAEGFATIQTMLFGTGWLVIDSDGKFALGPSWQMMEEKSDISDP